MLSSVAKMDWDRARRIDSVRNNPIRVARLGPDFCPECSGSRWWDNKTAKKWGYYKKTAPDAECANCGYKLWPKKKS